MTTESQYARPRSTSTRSTSPLFDSMIADLEPGSARPMTPIVSSSRTVRADTAPIWMQPKATSSAPSVEPTPTAPIWMQSAPAQAAPASTMPTASTLLAEPLSGQQLTSEEREIIAEMGGTVARLILQMMHDEQPGALRR